MNEIIIYQASDNTTQMDVRFDNETCWLLLNQIAALSDRDKSVISRHLKNSYKEGELQPEATIAKNATVQKDGAREIMWTIEYYNLDAILSVGYLVNAERGKQFS